MDHKLIISSVAYDDLNQHFYFLAQVSQDAAQRLKAELIEDMRSLLAFPERHPAYERPYLSPGKYRYMLSCHRYRIIYQIEHNVIYIDAIQDCRKG